MSARSAIKEAKEAFRLMTVGADEFMEGVAAALCQPPGEWTAATQELIASVMRTIVEGRAAGSVDKEATAVLAAGPDIPILGGLVFPRPRGTESVGRTPPPLPWFDHLDGEAADAWREELGRHTGAVSALTGFLEEGMRGVELPGVKTETAVANCVVYGAGCLIMAGGVGLFGNVRRLAGALMAYMLFDHIGDSLQDHRLRRMVHRVMMQYWVKGEWPAQPAKAVMRVLKPPLRQACERSRAWVSSELSPADAARVAPQLGVLAQAIATDVQSEDPEDSPIGVAETVDVARLRASLKKNVAAVAFLLFAYLDDPRRLRPDVLHMAGRAAMFAQLFDDLLDRDEDVNQRQHTVVTGLCDEAYRHLTRVAASLVPEILHDVRQVAPKLMDLLRPLQEARIESWTRGGALLIYLMTRHRNRDAFGATGADLADRVCGGESPFIVLRAVRSWLAPRSDQPGQPSRPPPPPPPPPRSPR